MPFRRRNPIKSQPHHRYYQTVYMSPETIALIDKLKEQWHLKGRGKVIERVIRAHFNQQEKTDEVDPLSRL